MKKDSVVRILDKIAFVLICLYAGTICLAPHIHFANIAFGVALIRICLQRPRMKLETYHLQFVGVFLIALLCSVFFNDVNAEYGKNLMYYRSNFLSPLMLGLAVLWIGFSENEIRIFFILAIASLFINDFVVIWQGLQGITRPAGFAGSYMFLGGMLLFLCSMLLVILMTEDLKYSKKLRGVVFIILFFSLIAVLYNATRIVWIGLGLTALVLFFLLQYHKKRYGVYFLIAVVIFSGVFMMNPAFKNRLSSVADMNNVSNSERILMWNSAWNMFNDHPLFGVGIGNYVDQFEDHYKSSESKEEGHKHPHNVLLSMLSQAGIIGGISYLVMFLYFLGESFLFWKNRRLMVALMFSAVTFVYLINGLTDCNFGGPFLTPLNDFYYFMLACYLILSGKIHYPQKE